MSEATKTKSTITTQYDELGRKKFKIQERVESDHEQEAVAEATQQKSMLIGREENLNIEKYVGTIEANKKSKKKEVFFCDVCNEGFKCDMAYITHLNSPKHNRKLGMSMKVKAVSAEEVVQKLKSMKNPKSTRPEDREMAKFLETAFTKRQQTKEQLQQKQEPEDAALAVNEQEGQEEDLQAELRAYGLPSSFSSKKQKR